MGKFTRTWSLMWECWQVLKAEKSLLVFPLISGVCCLMLMASFAIPIWATGTWRVSNHDLDPTREAAYAVTLFSFYVANYFIVVFFNAAIVACAAIRLTGGSPTVGDGLRAAASRLPAIAGWALVSATVGMILRMIEDRSDKIGQIIAGLLGMAWTVIGFLVVPILVIDNKGPIAALKESTSMLKTTWGEQLISNFSFGSVFSILSLPAIALVILGFYLGGATVGVACGVVAIIYWIVLALIHSALQAIFQTALYLYARDGHVEGFRPEVMQGAMG